MPRKDCVTTIGLQRMASILAANSLITHMAFGDNDQASQVSDVTLLNEIYREALDGVQQDDVTVRGELVIAGSDIGSGAIELKEVSLQDASVGGNTICRHVLNNTIEITGAQLLSTVYGLVMC